MLKYSFPNQVEAFTTGKGEKLPYAVLQPHQVHLDKVVVIDEDFLGSLPTGVDINSEEARELLQGVDALVTNLKDFAIGVRTADCVPVLLYDPEHEVVAAVHCGWRGTVQKLSQKTIRVMSERFGTDPSRLFAAIGPSISPEAFQVGEEVVKAFEEACFPMHEIHHFIAKEEMTVLSLKEEHASFFAAMFGDPTTQQSQSKSKYEGIPTQMRDGHHIDLWMANQWLLTEMGVKLENIEISGVCTYKGYKKLYSARKEGNQKGKRNINFIKIR